MKAVHEIGGVSVVAEGGSPSSRIRLFDLTAKFLKGRVYGRAPSSGRDQALSVQGQARFARFWLSGGVRPKGWTGLGGSFDHLPSVVVLELRGAQVAER